MNVGTELVIPHLKITSSATTSRHLILPKPEGGIHTAPPSSVSPAGAHSQQNGASRDVLQRGI